jgi:hypothetical protein
LPQRNTLQRVAIPSQCAPGGPGGTTHAARRQSSRPSRKIKSEVTAEGVNVRASAVSANVPAMPVAGPVPTYVKEKSDTRKFGGDENAISG